MSDNDITNIVYIWLDEIVTFCEKINQPNEEGYTPLMFAIIHNIYSQHMNKAKYLIKAGADVNIQKKYTNPQNELYTGWSAIMFAAKFGFSDAKTLIEILIEAGADVNKKDYDKWTALTIAIRYANEFAVDIVQVLIKAGADVNAQTFEGWTPLLLSPGGYWYKHTDVMMRILISAGVDVNVKNKYGMSALMRAIEVANKYNTVKMVQALVDAGADVNAKDMLKRTVLMIAITCCGDYSKQIIYTLVNAGADIYIKGVSGTMTDKTACDIAKNLKNFDMVDILQLYDDNWSFKWTAKNNIQLKLWSAQNIKIATTIILCWRNSYLSTIPWDLIREYILPMTIDRKDTIKLKRARIN